MISSADIKVKATRWWNDKSFLLSVILDEPFFPREVPQIKLVTNREKTTSFLKITQEQEQLREQSKEMKGSGYTLEWEAKNHQKIGNNGFIKRISFDSERDYINFIGKGKELDNFRKNLSLILERLPTLRNWVISNPLALINYHGEWETILAVCEYFMTHHKLNKHFIRELPIKVHTKFIETHKEVLSSLFDFLLPNEMVSGEFVGNRNFEKRYGLKYNQPLIRIKILDQMLSRQFLSGVTDLSITEKDFKDLSLPLSKAIIVENKTNYSNIMNFLTLPSLSSSVAIFGGGFGIGLLKDVKWLRDLKIYYWGDIDTQGFQILSLLRGFFSHTQSIMMDDETLHSFKEDWGLGTETTITTPVNLTPDEGKLFALLKERNIRLEQEKISHPFVVKQFEKIDS